MFLNEPCKLNETILETPSAVSGPVLLRAEGLKKSFGGQKVLDGTSLELRSGEVVLLRGENGSGKTTLLNMLTGNLEPEEGTISYMADDTPRSYRFPRRWWQNLNPFDHFTPEFVAREGVGRTWQDVRLFGSLTLRDNIALASSGHIGEKPVYALCAPGTVQKKEQRICEEADALLRQLGLVGRENSSADMVSLGQTKRVAIARAVTAGARILFLDEPLAGLDHQGITDVLALLKMLARDYSVTLVIIEHVLNLEYLREFATTDWLLIDGKIVRKQQKKKQNNVPPTTEPCFPQRPSWFSWVVGPDAVVIDEPLPQGAYLTRVRNPGFHQQTDPASVLSIEGLGITRGNRKISWDSQSGDQGLSLTIQRGEVVFLQAPNGWGKTTLLEGIAGLLPAQTGRILLEGVDIKSLKIWERAQAGIRTVMATNNVFVNMSGHELLRLAGSSAQKLKNDFSLERSVSKLSGGQRQKLALHASRTREQPCVYLYDEPFSMLDDKTIKQFRSLFTPDNNYGTLVTLPSTTLLNKEFAP